MICVSTYSSCYERKRKRYDTATTNCFGPIEIQIEVERQFRRRFRRQKLYHRDWAHIGADLLEYIQQMLPLADILRCRAVCRSWRSVTKSHLSISLLNSLPKPSSPPLIIWNEVSTNNECFFDVLTTDGEGSNLYLPNTKSQLLLGGMVRCVGSSNLGYFLLLDREDEKKKTLFLFHPMLFSGSNIRLNLPSSPTKKVDGYPIKIAALWADPISSSSYGLVVLRWGYKPPLFAKCGATQFTPLECRDPKNKEDMEFVRIMCVKDRIYGITLNYFNAWDCTACIGSSDVPRLVLEFKPKFSSGRPPSCCRVLRLVESEGEILLVAIERPNQRRWEASGGNITEYNKLCPMCEVYKMDFKNKEWVRMNSLGDRVLFVMEYQSMSLCSHDFPQYQRNSIYFLHRLRIRDTKPSLGIFNMEDGSIKVIAAKKC